MPTRSQKRKPVLPRYLTPYFWDADPKHLDMRRHSKYIIERILEYGNDRAIHWLQDSYSPAQIGSVVRSSRVISRNTANLWALLLHIPRNEIQCFSKRSPLTHSAFSKS
jgi:hypothetical protein